MTPPEHLSSPPVFIEIRVARSLVFCLVLCRSSSCLFCTFSNFLYVFHIKLQFFRSLSWSQFTPDFDNFYINKNRIFVVLLYNFKIIFYDKHFENIQAKHTTELFSFEIQCFDRTFVDKLFKSVFKSWQFEKNMLQKVISKLLL